MTDIETLTGSRGWGANPHDYNRLNILTFGSDGCGRLVLGHGQTVLAEVNYRFEVPQPGVLRLAFIDATASEDFLEHGRLGRLLVEAERGNPRELKYVLSSGDFRGDMNMGSEHGPFSYHFRAAITFSGPPYSESTVLGFGHRCGVVDYTYHGHPVVGDAGTASRVG
jgi:hypothetical protein